MPSLKRFYFTRRVTGAMVEAETEASARAQLTDDGYLEDEFVLESVEDV